MRTTTPEVIIELFTKLYDDDSPISKLANFVNNVISLGIKPVRAFLSTRRGEGESK